MQNLLDRLPFRPSQKPVVDPLDESRRRLWKWRWVLYVLSTFGALFLLIGAGRVVWNLLKPYYQAF